MNKATYKKDESIKACQKVFLGEKQIGIIRSFGKSDWRFMDARKHRTGKSFESLSKLKKHYESTNWA